MEPPPPEGGSTMGGSTTGGSRPPTGGSGSGNTGGVVTPTNGGVAPNGGSPMGGAGGATGGARTGGGAMGGAGGGMGGSTADASRDTSSTGGMGNGGMATGGADPGMGGAMANAPCTDMPAATPPSLTKGPAITGFAGQAGQVVGVPGENTLYVIGHRNGNVYTVQNGMVAGTPFLHVDNSAGPGNEQGLLSMALHPQFATNKLFYIFYTPAGMAQSRVEEWERTSVTQATFKQAIYTGPGSGRFHNGGSIYFNPKDTRPLLYHSIGNAETAEAGSPTAQRGRVVRYDVSTKMGVPAMGGNFGMWTYVYGLRNPYRMSIDRLTGDMYIGDVANGPGGTIIFNAYGKEGTDFGYRSNNGTPDVNNGVVREGGGAAIIGGVVYRGRKIQGLCGRYFYGVHAGGTVKSFVMSGGQRGPVTTHATLTVPGNISSFGEDGDGEIWMSSMGGNAIYKIIAGP